MASPVEVELVAAVFDAEPSKLEICMVVGVDFGIGVLRPVCEDVEAVASDSLLVTASVVTLPVILAGLAVGANVDSDAAPVDVDSAVVVST